MLSILYLKKSMKLLHLSMVNKRVILSMGFSSLLTVANSVRGLEDPE